MKYLKELEKLGIKVVSLHGDEAMCYCPLHEDSNASLSVNVRTGLHNCFAGCTKGSFQKLRENVAGIAIIKDVKLDNISIVSKTQLDRIQDLGKVINSYNIAYDNSYLYSRGFDNDLVKKWNIREGYTFIAIPIYNEKQEIQGIFYRMTNENEKRYSRGFSRNNNLFGLNHITQSKLGIIVEGCFDCIRVHQFGGEALATLGINVERPLSSWQIKKISSMFDSVFILFDNDETGRKSTIAGAEALVGKVDVYIPDYSFYNKKDPGEMLKTDFKLINESKIPYLLYKLRFRK